MKFEEFKSDFYRKAGDLTDFNAGDVNLVKVVLDGLKVNYAARGRIRVIIFSTHFFIRNSLMLLRWRNRKVLRKLTDQLQGLKPAAERKYIMINPSGRTVKSKEGEVSMYFGNIIKSIGRENVVVLEEGNKKASDDVDVRLPAYDLGLAAAWEGLNEREKKVLRLLKLCYSKICARRKFSTEDISNISIAFQQFFIQYRVWNRILESVKPDTALLWPHYHREGCIYALKERGIKVIELQHGLIAPEDIFYVLPAQAAGIAGRALFADEIWVYGRFWKEQLMKGAGYTDEQIKVKGYFPVSPDPEEEKLLKWKNKYSGKQIILVTTQTFLANYFCEYISFLSKDLMQYSSSYVIFVKLHPAEHAEQYASIVQLPNVEIVNENLDFLFRLANMNISIYSTTLFDGLRFGVPGYAIWYDRFSDYLSFFSKSGIIRVIQPDENPVRSCSTMKMVESADYYYEQFDSAKVIT